MKCVSLSVWLAWFGADRQRAGFSVNSMVSCALHALNSHEVPIQQAWVAQRQKQEGGVMMCWRQLQENFTTWIERHSILSGFLVKGFLCNASVALFPTGLALWNTTAGTKLGNPERTPKKNLLFPLWQHLTAYWTFHSKPLALQPVSLYYPPTAKILVSAASDHWCLLGGWNFINLGSSNGDCHTKGQRCCKRERGCRCVRSL